jgi:hypothetical protein
MLHTTQVLAQVAGQDIVLTLQNGSLFRGVLVKREQHGYLMHTTEGTLLVPYEEVREVAATSAIADLSEHPPETPMYEPHLPASVVGGWAVAATAGALALSLLAAERASSLCDFTGPEFQPKTACHRDQSLWWLAASAGVVSVAGVGVALWGHLHSDLTAGVQVSAKF